MNPNDNKTCAAGTDEIDASCRVSLLALFGGAALWLVVGLVLGLIGAIKFHAPEFLSACPLMTYGRVAPAANDAILYGFCIPAALGVMLWIFARLSNAPLALPIVPVVAAHIWHLGVFVGMTGILIGESTGHPWLEFPRAAAALLFAAFLLIAVTAAATFGLRENREAYPSHWFLFAALLLFPWIYSSANLLLIGWPVRGVVQSVIGWWFANNLVFVWLALAGIGTAFYFLPKMAGRPLASSGYALFGFLTLLLFGTWCGIPQGAPVPAWLPTISSVAAALTLVPLLAIFIVTAKTVGCAKVSCQGGTFCFIKFGMMSLIMSGLLYVCQFCPQYSRVLDFTWFAPAQAQLQLLGFFAMVMFGAIYHVLPRVMGFELPFPKLAKAHFWVSILGVVLFVFPLMMAGIAQGVELQHSNVAFADANLYALKFLRVSTLGQPFILLGALLFAVNLFAMTIKWKIALLKSLITAVTAPLEVKA
ncbi:MAG TPA: cbb3-type cytochrome c oxidase subunit I [Verrucomicrobiae bacterium]|jgi:cytochrome c oxidase cbb3-type subunit 1